MSQPEARAPMTNGEPVQPVDVERLVPYPDRDSAPWWAAVARHELAHQRCDDCAAWRWPPRAMCSECGSFAWSWQPVTGRGTVISCIRTHHAFLPGFAAPYHTVFVSIDEQADIVMPGTWHHDIAPTVGMRVQVHYDDVAVRDGAPVTLVGWQPAED
jgi:uncharacterized OB-fold protein